MGRTPVRRCAALLALALLAGVATAAAAAAFESGNFELQRAFNAALCEVMASGDWSRTYNDYFALTPEDFVNPFDLELDCNLTLHSYVPRTALTEGGALDEAIRSQRLRLLTASGLSGITHFEAELVAEAARVLLSHYSVPAEDVRVDVSQASYSEILEEDAFAAGAFDLGVGGVVSGSRTYKDTDLGQGCLYLTPMLALIGFADGGAGATRSGLCPAGGGEICYLNDYYYGDLVDLSGTEYTVLPSEEDMLAGLQNGICDCILTYTETLRYFRKAWGGYDALTDTYTCADYAWLGDLAVLRNVSRVAIVPLFHADRADTSAGNTELRDAFSAALARYASRLGESGRAVYEELYEQVFGETEFMMDLSDVQGSALGSFPSLNEVTRGGTLARVLQSCSVRVLELAGWDDGFHTPERAGLGDLLLAGALGELGDFYGVEVHHLSVTGDDAGTFTPSALPEALVRLADTADMAFGSIVVDAQALGSVQFGASYASQHFAASMPATADGVLCDDVLAPLAQLPLSAVTVADSAALRFLQAAGLGALVTSATAAEPGELRVDTENTFWIDAFFSYRRAAGDACCVCQFRQGAVIGQGASPAASDFVNLAPAFRLDASALSAGAADSASRAVAITAVCLSGALLAGAVGVGAFRCAQRARRSKLD